MQTMSACGLSILVPAFNEGGNITAAIQGVVHAAELSGITEYEVIIVDDGSTDGTVAEAATACRTLESMMDGTNGLPLMHVVRHQSNRGLRAAYETGLAAATMPYITWTPGDGEMATGSIAAIFRAVGTADLVIPYHGTPERRTWFRRLLTWGSTTQLNWLLGHDLPYFQGTVVYPTALARSLPRTTSGFFFCAEMLAHALETDPTYTLVPLVHQERQHGVSKAVSWGAIWRAQKHIVRLWWRLRVRTAVQALGLTPETP